MLTQPGGQFVLAEHIFVPPAVSVDFLQAQARAYLAKVMEDRLLSFWDYDATDIFLNTESVRMVSPIHGSITALVGIPKHKKQ